MLLHPNELGRGEAGERNIPGDGAGLRLACFDLLAFGEGAGIVPQDRRAQYLVAPVEQCCAMLLARQADAFDRRDGIRLLFGERLHHDIAGSPPMVGMPTQFP